MGRPFFSCPMIRTTVRYKGIRCDYVVSPLVPFLVSSCGPFCYMASRPPSRLFVSLIVSSWHRVVPFVSSGGPCGGTILRGVLFVSSCYIVIALASSRLACLVLRYVGTRRFCVFAPCRRASCAVSFSYSLRSPSSRPRSPSSRSSFVVVSVGRFWASCMRGNRADKNGAFCPPCHLRLIRLVLVLRGDGNRSRSNGSEARDRCRYVRTPGAVVYARKSFFANQSSRPLIPRPGGRGSI